MLSLIGGLSLFLYGMHMMSTGMEEAAGDKMKSILQKLTGNRIVAVLVGALITCVIQSSSATTVMVVGFVNSRMMTLSQAVGVIMGANIGTTITGQLIALDVGVLAPILAFVGVAIVVFIKKPKWVPFGSIIAGLGVLFIGMDMMSAAMEPLRKSQEFINIVSTFSNPLIGILVGAGFTAIIQSSSASVGILQGLARSGVVQLNTAVYVLFGQNIGTCITAVLAAIGTKRNAKRTTIIHLTFNIIGTIIFTIVCMTLPLTALIESLTPSNPAAQIANMHTLFNIVTTLILLPFSEWLTKFAMMILPEKEQEINDAMHLKYLQPLVPGQERKFGSSEIYLAELQKELMRMLRMTKNNLIDSFDVILEEKPEKLANVKEQEEYIDYLNNEIGKSISYYIPFETNPENTRRITSYFNICGNVERIGDHALNIAEYSQRISEDEIEFSKEVKAEIFAMKNICSEILGRFFEHLNSKDLKGSVEKLEQVIDQMTEEYRNGLISRMKEGTDSQESCVIYSEILVDFERIGDHALNIAVELKKQNIQAA